MFLCRDIIFCHLGERESKHRVNWHICSCAALSCNPRPQSQASTACRSHRRRTSQSLPSLTHPPAGTRLLRWEGRLLPEAVLTLPPPCHPLKFPHPAKAALWGTGRGPPTALIQQRVRETAAFPSSAKPQSLMGDKVTGSCTPPSPRDPRGEGGRSRCCHRRRGSTPAAPQPGAVWFGFASPVVNGVLSFSEAFQFRQ